MDSTTVSHPQPIVAETPNKSKLPLILVIILVIAAGIGTGYFMSRSKTSATSSSAAAMVKSPTEAGTTDTKTFKDYATGQLEDGGINGEGTHHLVRPGGTSQTVYLISSIVDLGPFVGKKVEIYGQTIRAKSAGWLMDVGRIKVIE